MAPSRTWIVSLAAFLLLSESLISARALGSSAATGIFNEAAIPSPVAGAREITFGRGGWWFTEFAANKVGRLGPSGNVVEFAIPTASSGPLGIAYDGLSDAIWFTEFNA